MVIRKKSRILNNFGYGIIELNQVLETVPYTECRDKAISKAIGVETAVTDSE